MKLNWFSPLNPAASAIASYTRAVLPFLAPHAEVTVWTHEAEWTREMAPHASVRWYDPNHIPWVDLNRADLSIYHMGNNLDAHAAIWAISRQHPGLVVLHDFSFHHMVVMLHQELHDRDGYLAAMERLYGAAGTESALECWSGKRSLDEMADEYPLTELMLEGSLGVLVHTRDAFVRLEPRRLAPLAYAPLPYAAATRQPRKTPTASDASGPYRCIMFGHLHPNRCVGAVVEALAQFPARRRLHLDVYGTLWDADAIAARIHLLGLSDSVTLHGFVSASELDRALATADLAINLRYPSMGEASFSQLQIWDHALPSLVSRTGWYAGLPDGVVAFVRPEHEREDLHAQLHAFLEAPDRFAALGRRGWMLLHREHAPEAYVETLRNLVSAAVEFRPQAVSWQLATRAAAAMRGWMSGADDECFLLPVAQQIVRLCGNDRRTAPARKEAHRGAAD